jgi:hypothetical protein
MDVTGVAARPAAAPAASSAVGARPTAPATVDLHIDSLVLTGFRPEERHAVGSALQRELTRLLTIDGVPSGIGNGLDASVLRASAVDLPRDAHPATAGARLARAVYQALARAGGGR